MHNLKLLFVGIGSIAKRHIRNLREIFIKFGISAAIDAYRYYPDSAHIEGIHTVYSNLIKVPDDYDAIFITNPTNLHLETLRIFHDKGRNFFIEKPAVSLSQLEAAKDFLLKNSAVYYVACPLRYNAVISYIKENIPEDNIISVRSISSSYLPDWRPGQDYRKSYSAHKESGGGVSIDLIHEWDYLSYLFGMPQKISCMIGKKSNLEINSEDYAIYIAELSNKIIELHLDYFGRKTIREIQLFTKDDTIIGNIADNKINFLASGKSIDFHEERDDYQKRELEKFLELIMTNNSFNGFNSFTNALDVISLTQGEIRTCRN